MFTGIIEEIGKVESTSQHKLTISAKLILDGTVAGDSISVNGACLTVTQISNNNFVVDIMEETRRRTNIGMLKAGNRVNLERAMTINGRIGGHLVQGHIDGTGKIISIMPENEATLIKIEAPESLTCYIVEKGFIAVDGISLTVVSRDPRFFTVSIVQYTKRNTILSEVKIGDIVNLEIDIMAKYVEQFLKRNTGGLSENFLKEHGFN